MKKQLLLLCFFVVGMIANAQNFTLETKHGTPIPDGTVLVRTSVAQGDGTDAPENGLIYLKVKNNTANEVKTRLLCEDIINADGSNFRSCYGLCSNSITIGGWYPTNGTVNIAASGNSSGWDNIWNKDDSGTNFPVDYKFALYEIDNGGNKVEPPVRFTYRYNPTLSLPDVSTMDITVTPTVITKEVFINTPEALNIFIHDSVGRKVRELAIESGNQAVDMSGLAAQMYILTFENKAGKRSIKRVVVR